MARKRRLLATPRRTDKGWLLVMDCGHWKFMKSKPRNMREGLCRQCPDKVRR